MGKLKPNRWLTHVALLITTVGVVMLSVGQLAPEIRPTQQAPSVAVEPRLDGNAAIGTIAVPRFTVVPDEGSALQRGMVLNTAEAPSGQNSNQRVALMTHIVQAGDTLWDIALAYGLRPETILWSNYETLSDNPDLLSIGMSLVVPPEDGLMVEVEAGDTVDALARQFKVKPEVLTQEKLNGLSDINQALKVGQALFVRGGERELVVWQLPKPVEVGTQSVQTTRGVVNARVYRVGVCGNVAIPALGTGTLIYPTGSRFRSGYNFSRNHGGIDFGGRLGSPIYAADSGTAIFAGDATNARGQFVGYGRYVVLDHGNGYQTLYAHNSSLTVSCGQQVSKGEVIAYMGSTGKSTGPHSHFEVRLNGAGVNPWGLFR